MASTYSTSLRLELIGTGDQSGTWGETTNTNLGTLLEQAIGGYQSITMTDANYTLSTANGAADEARNMVLRFTGTLSTTRNVSCPNGIEKAYVVINDTSGGQSIIFKTASGTGVTIPNGKKAVVYVDGTNVLSAFDNSSLTNATVAITSGTISGLTSPLAAASGGTGNASYTIGDLLFASGATTLSRLADVATGNALISGGVGVAPAWGKIGLTTHVSGTLPVANGGTGATTLTGVLKGNGTSAFTAAVAGTDFAGVSNSNTFTSNQIISVTDNTNAALRITQLGTGDAILVEDSSNPDATPFVIDQTGILISGHTSGIQTDGYTGLQTPLRVQVHGTATASSTFGNTLWNNSNVPVQMIMSKSRSGTIGSYTTVQSGDNIGALAFSADDGSAFVVAGSIIGAVDGTPGTNDMPGRLLFSTTADGASAPTERMRINSLGSVNIGTAANPESALQITGATTPTGLMIGSISGTTLTVSGVTSGVVAVGDRVFVDGTSPDYNTYITALGTGTGGVGTYTINNSATVAGGTTINFFPSRYNTIGFVETDTTSVAGQPFGGIEWYSSDASTPGVGVKAYVSAVSEGINAQSSLRFGTATTTASTQAVERMRIDSSGNVGIGTNSPGSNRFSVLRTDDGAVAAFRGTVGNLSYAEYSSISYLWNANTPLLFGTSSNHHLGIGTNNLERMRIDANGNVGIGTSALTGFSLRVSKNITGSGTASAVFNDGTIQSDATAIPTYFSALLRTAATSFTIGDAQIYRAATAALGAGSAITRLYGYVAAELTAGTTNYGFFTGATAANVTTGKTYYGFIETSNIATGGGTSWAVYAQGTAPSYFNGQVQHGAGSVGTPSIAAFGDTNTGMWFPAADTIAFSTGGTEATRINSSGNIAIGTTDLTSGSRLVINNNASASSTSIALYHNGNYNGQMGLGVLTGFGDTVGLNARAASGTIVLGTNNTTRLTITGAGNVGVGTSSPGYLFEANGQSAATQFVLTGAGNRYITSSAAGSGIVLQTNGSTEAVVLTSAGRVGVGTGSPACALDVVGGIRTSRTSVTSPAATDGNVFSGTYTPTLTNTANVAASTAHTCQYMRVGNVVTVSGRVSIDPTTANTLTTLGMSFPIASSITAQTQVGGTFSSSALATNTTGAISGNTGNNRADFDIIVGTDVANRSYYFSFTYLVS